MRTSRRSSQLVASPHQVGQLIIFLIHVSSICCYTITNQRHNNPYPIPTGGGNPNPYRSTEGGNPNPYRSTGGGNLYPYSGATGAGRASEGSPPYTAGAAAGSCSPNVYLAPTINCSTDEVRVELKRIQQDVALLYENMQRLVDRVGSALPGVLPRDCRDVQQRGTTSSGTYTIQPDHNGWPFQVYCDMDTDGGGWAVFQRRANGSEDFRRGWASYRRGFGSPSGDFWLGLDRLHRLTYQDEYELRVDMADFDNIAVNAGYSWFRVDGTASNYRLHLGEYSGVAGDSMSYHDGQQFSTKDRDHDSNDTTSCSRTAGDGGWWFNHCVEANPNGLYLGGQTERSREGVVWASWKGPNYSLKMMELKLRPVAD